MMFEEARRGRPRSTWSRLVIRVRRMFWGAPPEWTKGPDQRESRGETSLPPVCYEIE